MRGQIDFILRALTGTNNVNIVDDLGTPSVMVKVPKFKISDVIPGGPATTHPMFIVNGVEKDAIYIGKYEAVIDNLRAYSLPGRVPENKIPYSKMIESCWNKGDGWHAMTNAEYAGLSLLSRANGTLPRGNDYNGRSNRKIWERGKLYSPYTYDKTKEITSPDRYPGEQVRIDWTGDKQTVDLTGVTKFKLDSYTCGSTDGTTKSYMNGGTFDVPSGVKSLSANIKHRTDYPGTQPVLVMDKGGTTYNTTSSYSPCVIKDGDTYKMWFTGSTPTERIMYATSPDGKTWSPPTLVVDIGTSAWTGSSISHPCVIKDGDTYKMWVSGSSDGTYFRIVYMTSSDGITWSKPSLVMNAGTCAYNATYSHVPWVIKDGERDYKMWFVGYGSSTSARILFSTSIDGIVWTTPVQVADNGFVAANATVHQCPCVFRDETNLYRMLFTSNTNGTTIMTTKSRDGVNWSTPVPMIQQNTSTYCTKQAHYPRAIYDNVDDIYKVWFGGSDGTNVRILYAEVPTGFENPSNLFAFDNGTELELKRAKALDFDLPTYKPDLTGHYYPFTLKNSDGTYEMWLGRGGSETRMEYLTSNDAINWSRPVTVNFASIPSTASAGSYCPCVIKNADKTYEMFVSAFDGTNSRIYRATSNDGVNWSAMTLIITNSGPLNSSYTQMPFVIKESDTSYKMWFAGRDSANDRIMYTTSTDGKTWTAPVLSLDIGGTAYNPKSNYSPVIVKESDSLYKMWFIGAVSTTVYKLMYTTSTDGIKWDTPTMVMGPNTCKYNTSNVGYISAIKDGNLYRMWIMGNDGTNWNTLNTVSSDGINWSIPQLVSDPNMKTYSAKTIDGSNLTHVSILQESTSLYKMWFSTNDSSGVFRICYSTSKDLVNWSEPILVMDKGIYQYMGTGAMNPEVIKESATSYKMWFNGYDGTNSRILLSTSVDGIHWNAPVLVMDKGTCAANSQHSYTPNIIKESDTSYKMWFTGNDNTNYRILYSTSIDGKIWSVPVIAMNINTCSFNTVASEEPTVIKESSNSYKMWFTGLTSLSGNNGKVLYSTSTDGVSWSAPVLAVENMAPESYIISRHPSVIKDLDNNYNMVLCGFDNTAWKLVYSKSVDGTTWDFAPPDKSNATTKKFCGSLNASNGYAIITVLETAKPRKFTAGEKLRFECTGVPVKLNTSNATKIKIECYGASGADAGGFKGAYGGYAYGELTVTNSRDLFIIAGGRGGKNTDDQNVAFNGGGVLSSHDATLYKWCGAGASDVRTVENDIKTRIIVAGGGGTADGGEGSAGAGGGWTGNSGNVKDIYWSTGGSQTAPGSTYSPIGTTYNGFETTKDLSCGRSYEINTASPTDFGVGGGGYYGGGTSGGAGGGGGSSYVSGNVNCPTTHPDGIILTNSGTTAGANTQKDGYIIMTILETTDTKRYNVGDKVRFNYTGSPQTFIQGNATKVKVECYGASGGYNTTESKGGYAYGDLTLAKVDVLSILVGGMGTAGKLGTPGKGGYNGGGDGGKPFTNKYLGGSGGGGATDVRSTIKTNIFDPASLASRLVVAGGGGGEITGSTPGDGGGWSGIAATVLSVDGSSLPGSQKIGYNLGQGGAGDDALVLANGSNEGNGGGGGGYYGGYGGIKLNNGENNDVSGAGGSSYVAGDANCPTPHSNGVKLANTGSTASTNTGDGYVIITVLEVGTDRKYVSGETYTYNCINDVQTFNTKNAKRVRIECFGPEGAKADEQCGTPGKGGYATGEIIFNNPQTLYLYAGGRGGYNTGRTCGYNGGGQATCNLDTKPYYGSGATDVRTVLGDLTSRLIVAGGGGSASTDSDTLGGELVPVNGYDGGGLTSNLNVDGSNMFQGSVLAMNIATCVAGYNSTHNMESCVIKDGDVYKMWVTGSNGTNYRILYSTSTDGLTWTAPILSMNIGTNAAGYNSVHTMAPCVVKDGSVYKMWFTGSNGSNYRILYSTSSDGITWTAPVLAMNIATNASGYNAGQSYDPSIIKESDTSYKMWFTGSDGAYYRILYSTSTDGITWTAPVLAMNKATNASGYNSMHSQNPCVLYDSGSYKMWFTGYSGSNYRILYSTSTDGITWTAPVLSVNIANNAGGYDASHSTFTSVIKDSDRFKMWYSGGNGNYRILYCHSSNITTQTTPGSFRTTVTGQAGAGTTVAQKGTGSSFVFSGVTSATWITNYNTLFAPGAGGWFGGLSYNGPGQGGTSYVAGDNGCPTKHPDGVQMFHTKCEPGINKGDGKIVITILETEDTFRYETGDVIWFKYTGAPETFNTRNITKMKLETWGANGSNNGTVYYAGKGGYTWGDMKLNKDTELSVVVGSGGGLNTGVSLSDLTYEGKYGYNGGGYTIFSDAKAWAGGGATDIRTLLTGVLSDTLSLDSRIIVAGGGGSVDSSGLFSGCNGNASDGGGWIAPVPSSYNNMTGASQTAGGTVDNQSDAKAGAYGVGGRMTTPQLTTQYGIDYSGGGGGYYGGASNSGNGGGGGSSYASGDSNCLKGQSDGIILTNTGTIAGYNQFASNNGAAVITVLSTDDSVTSVDAKLVHTGTGPSSWSHNGQNTGIFDLVGNLHTLCTGIRIDGTTKEPQVILNNNAAIRGIDFSDETNWVALSGDGSPVAKGSGVKYTNAVAGNVSFLFNALGLTSASYIHKALGIVPSESGYDFEGAMHAFQNLNSNTMMNVCYRGGGVGDGSTINSIFTSLFKKTGNEDIDANRGFRVCYYEP